MLAFVYNEINSLEYNAIKLRYNLLKLNTVCAKQKQDKLKSTPSKRKTKSWL